MIELPADPWPVSVDIELIDFGFFQAASGGAAVNRIDRPGSRYRARANFPPMKPDVARAFAARMTRAKREGLRIEVPLLGVTQTAAPSAQVDGSDNVGTTLKIKGLPASYVFKEGFWLTVIETASGQRYLHQVLSALTGSVDGKATIQIEPPLRVPFATNSVILLTAPTIEGFIPDDLGWTLDVDWLVRFGASITIEERG